MENKKKIDSFKRGKRLAHTRIENNMTQADLAQRLSELSLRKTPLTIATISSWETGRRSPSFENLHLLSEIYQVSIDYLNCLTDDPNGTAETESGDIQSSSLTNTSRVLIHAYELASFDGLPVYIVFKNFAHSPQWGIVNKEKDSIICRDGILKTDNPTIEAFYINEPYYSQLSVSNPNYVMDISKLMNVKEKVYVEMKTTDKFIQGQYNGYYFHNENHTCLINNKGLTLPYDGVGIAYNAFLRKRLS